MEGVIIWIAIGVLFGMPLGALARDEFMRVKNEEDWREKYQQERGE